VGCRLHGFCNSVFEPEIPVAGDAPPGTYEVCEAVRQERIPVVAGLGVLALAALVASIRPRRRSAS
jgi:hypothetical protein